MLASDCVVNNASDESDLGQAAHYLGGAIVLGKPYDLEAVAKSYGVSPEELGPLVGAEHAAWKVLAPHFSQPSVEARLVSAMLGGGTADILSRSEECISIGDWKSGRLRRGHRHQLFGYAYNARETFGMPSSGYIDTAIVWLRFGEIDRQKITSDELDAWAREFMELEPRIGKVYSPGEHCGYCQRRDECVPYRRALGTAAAALVPVSQALAEGSTGSELAPAALAALYPQRSMLRRALDAYDSVLKAHLESGARLPTGDGKEVYLDEVERKTIAPRIAYRVLTAEGFTAEELASCMEIHKGAVEEVVAAKAPPRGKGRAKTEIIEKLSAAGAVSVTLSKRLATAKIKES
jgi:hypothetical protein